MCGVGALIAHAASLQPTSPAAIAPESVNELIDAELSDFRAFVLNPARNPTTIVSNSPGSIGGTLSSYNRWLEAVISAIRRDLPVPSRDNPLTLAAERELSPYRTGRPDPLLPGTTDRLRLAATELGEIGLRLQRMFKDQPPSTRAAAADHLWATYYLECTTKGALGEQLPCI